MKEIKALLKIWYKCNYKCNFCHAEFKKDIINIQIKPLLLKILLLKKKWVQVILLTWWESTLESHFFKIVNFIKKQWLEFWIVTNGSTVYSKIFLNKLEQIGIKYIYLSLHWYKEVHNFIVWDNNSYNKIISIISDLQNRKSIKLFLNYVITKENIYSVNDTLSHLNDLKFNNLKIKFSMLELEWIWNDEKLMVSPLLSSNIIKKVIKKYGNLNIFWDWFQICLFREFLHKRADLQTENIRYITEVYENKIFNTDYWNRIYLKKCETCNIKDKCYGIYKWYENYFKVNELINF